MKASNKGNFVVFSSEYIFEKEGYYYITQSKLDTFSLQCEPFESVTLCVPKKISIVDDSILIKLPEKYNVLPLYEMDGEGAVKRLKGVFSTFLTFLKNYNKWDIIYIRLFFWDALIAGILAVTLRKKIFVSLHGDIEEAVKINWKDRQYPKWFIERTAELLAKLTSWICYKGEILFVAGPVLAEKYTPNREDAVSVSDSGYSVSDIFIRDDTCLKKPITILYVGELAERKGIKFLLEAIKLVIRDGEDIILNIVGNGDTERYMKIVSELQISDKVNFLGYKSFGEPLFNEFKKADIFVLPSIGTEGLPRVLAEANAHSLPIIATEVGSSGYAVRECNCGLISDVGSSESLAENIIKIIHDDELRRNLVQGSFKRALIHTRENERRLVWKKLYEKFPNYVKKYHE